MAICLSLGANSALASPILLPSILGHGPPIVHGLTGRISTDPHSRSPMVVLLVHISSQPYPLQAQWRRCISD
jgi:hypothetical protein